MSYGRLKDFDKKRKEYYNNLVEVTADLNSCFKEVKDCDELNTKDITEDYCKIVSKIVSDFMPEKRKNYPRITKYVLFS